MGPGAGWRLGPGSYVHEQKGLFHDLTWREIQHFMITAAIGGWFAKPLVSIGVGLLHWNWHVFKDQTNWLELDTYISPGGGGPGQSLTSTNPPPSVEEVGRMITTPPQSERHARARILKKTRCPPGHRWSYRFKKCVKSTKRRKIRYF